MGTATNCTFCKALYTVNKLYLLNNECLLECPDGYYKLTQSSASISNTCEQCIDGCSKCTAYSYFKCTECTTDINNNNYYLAVNSTNCSQTCPEGQYFNQTLHPFQCKSCDVNCYKCSNVSTNCTFCWYINSITPVYLINITMDFWKCNLTCPDGYWPYTSPALTGSHQCRFCFDGCKTCTNNTNNTCLSCKNSSGGSIFYKWSNQTVCDTVCPPGEYINPAILHVCQVCNPACITCNSNVFCYSCYVPFFFDIQLSTCVAKCKTNYYGNMTDPTNYICSQCTAGCYECTNTGLLSCQSCQNVTVSGVSTVYYKVINRTECTVECPTGSYG